MHKINFNAGDWFFYRNHAVHFDGTMEQWPRWLSLYVREHQIQVVLLFGDNRPVHAMALQVARKAGLEVGVFEEGYVRPNYITFESEGVNGHSRMPRNPQAFDGPVPKQAPAQTVPMPFWAMVWFGFVYFGVGALGKRWFKHYKHHRPLALSEGLFWLRSLWRKHYYRIQEYGWQQRITTAWSGQYFFVPLQVYNDAQVINHSRLGGVEGFIERVMRSFAQHAPADAKLVFKHHPMDRGYRDYTRLIGQLRKDLGLHARVVYVHDLHTPTLLDHAKGVVVINSTVGLQALGHGQPTQVLGVAMYDMPGLTYQGTLDSFWTLAHTDAPNPELVKRYIAHLVARTQINGNFYRRLPGVANAAGVVWEP